MSLLSLHDVTLRDGRAAAALLDEASLHLDAGELVVVWGLARTGRTALLRVAAGIQPPDSGAIRFDGRDLRGDGLGVGIGWCHPALTAGGVGVGWRGGSGRGEQQGVLEELQVAQLARGIPASHARVRALRALERVEGVHCAPYSAREISGHELVRVSIAGALVLDPKLLILDEPTAGLDPHERDGLLSLLRSLADEGLAVLASAGDAAALAGADRALALSHGQLRGHALPQLAEVLPLHRASA